MAPAPTAAGREKLLSRLARSSLAVALVLALAGCGGEAHAPASTAGTAGPTTTTAIAGTIDPSVDPTIADQPPVVPRIDAAVKARLQAVLRRGRARGNRDAVFAKVGDSITADRSFLVPVGCGAVDWGAHRDLAAVAARWSATSVPRGWMDPGCRRFNSFTRTSVASAPGWTTDDLLTTADRCRPPTTPLRCELRTIKPSVALVMIGSNDTAERGGLDRFRRNLPRVVDQILAEGVIPVLSTIPPRLHVPSAGALVPQFNEVVRQVAGARQVPLWNYWLQLHGVAHYGLAYDLLHPAPAPRGAGDFTAFGLRYGYNLRNLGALLALQHVGAVVFDDGPPDR